MDKIKIKPPEGYEIPEDSETVEALVLFNIEDGMLIPSSIDGIALEIADDESDDEDEIAVVEGEDMADAAIRAAEAAGIRGMA